MRFRAVDCPRNRILSTPSFLVVIFSGLGCEYHPSPQEAGVSRRDSAGVSIVENLRGTWAAPWQVDPQPRMSIGSVGGDERYELDQVTGAIGFPDGRIVIANGGRMELLIYDRDGSFHRRVGGRGEGPGEFQSLEWLSRFGPDSILALDVRGQRVSYFDVDGNFARSVRLEPNAQLPFPRPVAFFSDGSFLGTKGTFSLGGEPPAGRVVRDLEPLFHISSDGRNATILGYFPGQEWAIVPTGPGGRLERRSRPFGRETAFAAARDRFYVADNESFEVRIFSANGELLQVVRKQAPLFPLELPDIKAYEDSVLSAVETSARRQMRTLFANLPPAPPTYPAFEPKIQIDSDLNLWIKESRRPGGPNASWSVFSESGDLLGMVQMPSGVEVLDIGADYLLGLVRDELDVEYVQSFHLRRGR